MYRVLLKRTGKQNEKNGIKATFLFKINTEVMTKYIVMDTVYSVKIKKKKKTSWRSGDKKDKQVRKKRTDN